LGFGNKVSNSFDQCTQPNVVAGSRHSIVQNNNFDQRELQHKLKKAELENGKLKIEIENWKLETEKMENEMRHWKEKFQSLQN
jgi:predicted RNase H-like nuclease (RuvC/YqgF family)